MLPPLLLIGAGRMGGAMFSGWCRSGLAPSVLVDPLLPPGLARAEDAALGDVARLPDGFAPRAAILAIKPQQADAVVPRLAALLPPDCVVLSILAGKPVARLSALLGSPHAVVRAMPNTPAAIGQGMSVAFAGPGVTGAQRGLCETLLRAVGEVAWIDEEALMDRITAISGSGPAYVFLLAEILEQAGAEMGIPPELARMLARRTVSGAGALLAASDEESAALRRAVTSAKGVTEQALLVLMEQAAWPDSLRRALAAAARRAAELAD